jgi:hypothetical protein
MAKINLLYTGSTMINIPDKNRLNTSSLPEYHSYLDLIDQGSHSVGTNSTMDIIVVPTGRPAAAITKAAQLAHETSTLLVVLCSKKAAAREVAQQLESYKHLAWCAIDIPNDYTHPMLTLTASTLIPTSSQTSSDISLKRNIGLILGKGAGSRLLFLDDDIHLQAAGLRRAASALSKYSVAGFSPHPDGFPDNSVAVHTIRVFRQFASQDKGNASPIGQHLNGGGLAVNLDTIASHFPEKIYDEDWLFMHDATTRKQVTRMPETIWQAEYDPFATPQRAAREEFGNIISTGLYDHLKMKTKTNLTEARYWKKILEARRQRLEALYETATTYNGVPSLKNNQVQLLRMGKISKSLAAAIKINQSITAEQCLAYYKAWYEEDTPIWSKHYAALPAFSGIEQAIEFLGLQPYAIYSE